jgi:hypothetical protein
MPHKQCLMIDDEDDIREVARLSLQSTEGWTVMTLRRHAAGSVSAWQRD